MTLANIRLGCRLRELRLKRKLSVVNLAEISGVNHATIYRIEQGLGYPSDTTVEALASALRVKAWQILYGYDE